MTMPDDFIDPQLVQKLIYSFICSFPYMVLILYIFKGLLTPGRNRPSEAERNRQFVAERKSQCISYSFL